VCASPMGVFVANNGEVYLTCYLLNYGFLSNDTNTNSLTAGSYTTVAASRSLGAADWLDHIICSIIT
jgi:hypothetical protein